jgi:hypothetical protein
LVGAPLDYGLPFDDCTKNWSIESNCVTPSKPEPFWSIGVPKSMVNYEVECMSTALAISTVPVARHAPIG